MKPYVLKEAMQCVMYSAHTVEELQTTSSSATFYGWKYVTGFAKMCIVHTKILIRFFDPAYSYTQ